MCKRGLRIRYSAWVIISMSEIEDVAHTEFDGLLEHVDLGELDVVESRSHG